MVANFAGDVRHITYRLYDIQAKTFLTAEWATWLDEAIVAPDHAAFVVGGVVVRFDGGPVAATPRDQGGIGGGGSAAAIRHVLSSGRADEVIALLARAEQHEARRREVRRADREIGGLDAHVVDVDAAARDQAPRLALRRAEADRDEQIEDWYAGRELILREVRARDVSGDVGEDRVGEPGERAAEHDLRRGDRGVHGGVAVDPRVTSSASTFCASRLGRGPRARARARVDLVRPARA